jgi:acyl-coenzyme A synthetase/AMP-(fatty) acid ligase
VWHHGDFIEINEHGGVRMLGRSDATLNPGGVRIGTAELYRQVEPLPEVEDSLVIGQEWEGDVRVILFVKMADGADVHRRAAHTHPQADPHQLHAAPRAGQDHRGRRHPVHHQHEEGRTRRPQHRARPSR